MEIHLMQEVQSSLPLLEIALVFVRLDHVASGIVNMDYSIM
jgi:hypothetical protein